MRYRSILLKALVACGFLTLPASSWAANGNGQITYISVQSNGAVIFYLNTAATGTRPACGAGQDRWAFSATTAAGQARLAQLLTAYSLRNSVAVYGTGTGCTAWPDTEDLNYMQIAAL